MKKEVISPPPMSYNWALAFATAFLLVCAVSVILTIIGILDKAGLFDNLW